MTEPGKVLVVDDNRTSRRKLALALKQLGHESMEAASGPEALALLATTPVDLVLLGIVMPDMDGYEVLRRLRTLPKLASIPVLVISGLDDDTAGIARAIELGAEDFLPKAFDPVLFRARVGACLEKRRLRSVELDHLEQIDKLTAAAEIMESGRFHPQNLKLEPVAARPDAIGRLASVFLEMAEQVYERERRLQRNIRLQKGITLLLAVGLTGGIELPLSVLLFDYVPKPVGVSFWVNLVAGAACLAVAALRGKLRTPPRTALPFILLCALLQAASTLTVFLAGGRVSGIMLSIIVALQGFIVFLIAASLRIEQPALRRFIGLGFGLAGVLVLILARDSVSGVNDGLWILVAALVPLLYGLIDILVAARQPPGQDPIAIIGMVLLVGAALLAPLVLVAGQFFVPTPELGIASILIGVRGLVTAASYIAYMYLIAVAGAVFGSQSAYVATLAGIGWSMLLLHESLSFATVISLALVVLGLALVGPKVEAGDVEVEFRRRARR